jgi:hypothetical protein
MYTGLSMHKRVHAITATLLIAAASTYAQDIATPTATAAGPWRTGVPVHCPDGRTIPAHTIISGPNVTPEELCGIKAGSGTTSTGGAVVSNTGNFQQDMLTNSVNLMIAYNTKNPFVSSFMQGAAAGFISSMFANNSQEEQRQREIMAQQILERQREAEQQRRIAEQQRLDAMYARLSAALKLEGLPLTLSLKSMDSSSPDGLQLKSMNSVGPEGLKLKVNDASPKAYGLKGLPGIYVGGPAGGDSTSSGSGANAEIQSASGNNPNLVNGPGSGTTGPGIPGLPGIYLDTAQPNQAPQLAKVAQTMTGPERSVTEDSAIQAAEKNPALTAPSHDGNVQSFQQADQEYKKTLSDNVAAAQQVEEAQRHVDSDKSAIEVARSQLAAIQPSLEQQQKFNQMLAAAKTDEEASMIARQNFDSSQIKLSASRDRAAAALAQTASPAVNVSSASEPRSAAVPSSATSNAVDLSHSSQPVSAQLLRPAVEKSGPIIIPPAPAPAVALTPTIPNPLEIDACLGAATNSAVPSVTRPTVEQLRQQLDIAKEALARLLETHLRENEERKDWAKEMKKSGVDIGYQAFDLSAKFVLGHYADAAQDEAEWAEKGFNRAQEALKAETNLSRQAALEAEIAAYGQQGARASEARDLLVSTAKGADQGAKLRDFRGLLNDNGGSYSKDNPIAQAERGNLFPALDGFKQVVKITLSDENVQKTLANWVKHAEYVPFIDRTVTIGSAVIDTGYDLSVEYVGFQQLQQADQNSELFYRGAAPLQKKIQSTVNQLKCYNNQ